MPTWLTAPEAEKYTHLTSVTLSQGLAHIADLNAEADEIQQPLHAAGEVFAGMPASLAILRQHPLRRIEILSVAVAKPLRNLGLASRMMKWIEEELSSRGYTSIRMCYATDNEFAAAMERLTKTSQGWIHADGVRRINVNRNGIESFTRRIQRISPRALKGRRIQMKRMSDLNKGENEQFWSAQLSAPRWAQPSCRHYDGVIEASDPLSSRVVFLDEVIAGWLIAYRVGKSMCCLDQWWLQPELRSTGASMTLLRETLIQALDIKPEYECFSYQIQSDNTRMIKLSQRQFESYAYEITNSRQSYLLLNKARSGLPLSH